MPALCETEYRRSIEIHSSPTLFDAQRDKCVQDSEHYPIKHPKSTRINISNRQSVAPNLAIYSPGPQKFHGFYGDWETEQTPWHEVHYGKPRLRSYSEEIGRYCCTGVAYARGMNSPKQASKRTGFAAMNAETIDAEGGTRGKRLPCHNPEGF